MNPDDQAENGDGSLPLGEAVEETPTPVGDRSGFDPEKLKAVLEALLYVSEQPLSLDRLVSVVGDCTRKEVRTLLDELNTEYLERGRAFEIVEVASGYQVRTRTEFASWIGKLQPMKPVRLSRAALESLAIVAYRQPVTRAEVESIRGVDTGAVLGSLLEKRLVRILGRKEVPGRPIIYGTSQDFLDLFGLKNLGSLPTLKEIEGMFEKQEDAGPEGPQDGGDGGGEESGWQGAGPDGPEAAAAAEPAEQDGPAAATGDGTDPGAPPTDADSPEEEPEEAADPEEEDAWEEEAGDLETAELDALLRAARTKVLAYEDVVEKEEDGQPQESDEPEEENEGAEDGEREAGAGTLPEARSPHGEEQAGGDPHNPEGTSEGRETPDPEGRKENGGGRGTGSPDEEER